MPSPWTVFLPAALQLCRNLPAATLFSYLITGGTSGEKRMIKKSSTRGVKPDVSTLVVTLDRKAVKQIRTSRCLRKQLIWMTSRQQFSPANMNRNPACDESFTTFTQVD